MSSKIDAIDGFFCSKSQGNKIFNFYLLKEGKVYVECIEDGKKETDLFISGLPSTRLTARKVRQFLENSHLHKTGHQVEIIPRLRGGWGPEIHEGHVTFPPGTMYWAMDLGFSTWVSYTLGSGANDPDCHLKEGPWDLSDQGWHFNTATKLPTGKGAEPQFVEDMSADDSRIINAVDQLKKAITEYKKCPDKLKNNEKDVTFWMILGKGLHPLQDMFSHTKYFVKKRWWGQEHIICEKGYGADDPEYISSLQKSNVGLNADVRYVKKTSAGYNVWTPEAYNSLPPREQKSLERRIFSQRYSDAKTATYLYLLTFLYCTGWNEFKIYSKEAMAIIQKSLFEDIPGKSTKRITTDNANKFLGLMLRIESNIPFDPDNPLVKIINTIKTLAQPHSSSPPTPTVPSLWRNDVRCDATHIYATERCVACYENGCYDDGNKCYNDDPRVKIFDLNDGHQLKMLKGKAFNARLEIVDNFVIQLPTPPHCEGGWLYDLQNPGMDPVSLPRGKFLHAIPVRNRNRLFLLDDSRSVIRICELNGKPLVNITFSNITFPAYSDMSGAICYPWATDCFLKKGNFDRLITYNGVNQISFWDIDTGKEIKKITLDVEVGPVVFFPLPPSSGWQRKVVVDGEFVAMYSVNKGQVLVFDLKTGKKMFAHNLDRPSERAELWRLPILLHQGKLIAPLSLSHGKQFGGVWDISEFGIWDIKTSELLFKGIWVFGDARIEENILIWRNGVSIYFFDLNQKRYFGSLGVGADSVAIRNRTLIARHKGGINFYDLDHLNECFYTIPESHTAEGTVRIAFAGGVLVSMHNKCRTMKEIKAWKLGPENHVEEEEELPAPTEVDNYEELRDSLKTLKNSLEGLSQSLSPLSVSSPTPTVPPLPADYEKVPASTEVGNNEVSSSSNFFHEHSGMTVGVAALSILGILFLLRTKNI